ncbi:hypothetical protein [Agreia sp. VKM Ac-1783]|uniref:hypothetical protein n=1 Tax=Agreia sp. VKM Ac-1783 TaxID=1938889 RepID=UPI000A2ADC25|nr:hypothetical protein [Agreia sp. VKM Ac-1783]SMQ71623.1 hypothetical protein SAMN06295943_2529 [Agreia sp. VKM Ac-1783]
MSEGLTPGVEPQRGSDRTEPDGPTTGRAAGLGIVALLFALLVASWLIQLSSFLQRDFGPFEKRLSDGGVVVWVSIAAAIAILSPIVVLILQARVHKRNPRHSIAAVLGAVVVLVIAVPTNTVVVGSQVANLVTELNEKAQPPTAAETFFERTGGDPRSEVLELGDETVRLLGGDPTVDAKDSDADFRVVSDECVLDNSNPGIMWSYQYDAGSQVDANGQLLVPEGSTDLPTATHDMAGVIAYWASHGVTATKDEDVSSDEQYRAEAEWLGYDSWSRPAPDVRFDTICLVD